MTEIPVIDIGRALHGSTEDKLRVAKQIDDACREIGFFTLTGHGIPRALFEACYASHGAFFDLPFEQKAACTTDIRPCWFQRDGYYPYLSESAAALMGREGPADYVEKFSVSRWVLDDSAPLPYPETALGRALRTNMKRYYAAFFELALELMRLVSLGLGEGEDHFDGMFDEAWHIMRWQRYPAMGEGIEHDTGVGAHTDFDVFTFLTNGRDGLEVLTKDGEWIGVRTESVDQIIVNIGDMMNYWTNDRYVSNLHRVRLTDTQRDTMVFGLFVNDDTVMQAIPSCLQGGRSRYEPLTCRQFLEFKTRQMYGDVFIDEGMAGQAT